jgi:hypothetical protein
MKLVFSKLLGYSHLINSTTFVARFIKIHIY